MGKKSEAVKAAIATGNILLSDGSMDDPRDGRPWEIHIPRSYIVASFSDEATARVVFDVLKAAAG